MQRCPAPRRTSSTRTTRARLVANGCKLVSEGANMPSTLDAVHVFREAGTLFGPGKAANAGGVAVSGLGAGAELAAPALDARGSRRAACRSSCATSTASASKHGAREAGGVDYVAGANLAGFVKVANGMLAHGIG